MFSKCNFLKKLELYNFVTKNVTNMKMMFYECQFLNELEISNFKVNENTNIDDIFSRLNNDCEIFVHDKRLCKIVKENNFKSGI